MLPAACGASSVNLKPGLKSLPGLAADAGSVLKHTDELVMNLNDISATHKSARGSDRQFISNSWRAYRYVA